MIQNNYILRDICGLRYELNVYEIQVKRENKITLSMVIVGFERYFWGKSGDKEVRGGRGVIWDLKC